MTSDKQQQWMSFLPSCCTMFRLGSYSQIQDPIASSFILCIEVPINLCEMQDYYSQLSGQFLLFRMSVCSGQSTDALHPESAPPTELFRCIFVGSHCCAGTELLYWRQRQLDRELTHCMLCVLLYIQICIVTAVYLILPSNMIRCNKVNTELTVISSQCHV